MFESQYLLIFSIFSSSSRYNHVAKLAHGLMGKDQKNKFLLPIKSWILLFFNYLFLLIVLYKEIFSMIV